MGLFIRQNENRSELQERLAAELHARAKMQSSSSEPIDPMKDSNYIKDTEQISGRAWIGFVITGVAIAILIAYFYTR